MFSFTDISYISEVPWFRIVYMFILSINQHEVYRQAYFKGAFDNRKLV